MRNGLTHELKNISAIFCDFLKHKKLLFRFPQHLLKKYFLPLSQLVFSVVETHFLSLKCQIEIDFFKKIFGKLKFSPQLCASSLRFTYQERQRDMAQ
jgi:hypothetical protein